MRATYGDLHWGKYSEPMAHYMDANLGAQDYDEDAVLEGWGDWAGIIGRRVLYINTQGFVTLFTFNSKDEARETYDALTLGWYDDEEENDE